MSPSRSLFAWLGMSAVLLSSCAATAYSPESVASGELVLRVRRSELEIWAGGPAHGTRVARTASAYAGLKDYVTCVPQAEEHANLAHSYGRGGQAASGSATVLIAAGLGLYLAHAVLGSRPSGDPYELDKGMLTLGSLAIAATLVAIPLYNHATGHAVDAVNFYNDDVGSVGATCKNLDIRPPVVADPALQLRTLP